MSANRTLWLVTVAEEPKPLSGHRTWVVEAPTRVEARAKIEPQMRPGQVIAWVSKPAGVILRPIVARSLWHRARGAKYGDTGSDQRMHPRPLTFGVDD